MGTSLAENLDRVLFCPTCFATSEDGSWGGRVEANGYCTNCGGGVPVGSQGMPSWMVKAIRKSASWVGKRYYPHEEDTRLARERRELLALVPFFPGRTARLYDPSTGQWCVDQWSDTGSVHSVFVPASSAAEAIEASRYSLPYFAVPKFPSVG